MTIQTNARGNIIYTPELVAELKDLTKDLPRAEGVRAVMKKLKKSPRQARDIYSRLVEKGLPIKQTIAQVAVSLKGRKVRRLFLDIEVSPNILLSWRVGRKVNLDYDNIMVERGIICICWRWQGEKKVHALHWDDKQDDRTMLVEISKVIREADEIVGHNLGRFDLPWLKARIIHHGLPPLPNVTVIDTLTIARRQFAFNSNRLDYIGKFLGFGGKIKTGFGLWKEIVLNKCEKSLREMIVYCQRDVDLLERVWGKLNIVVPAKTHAGVLAGDEKWVNPRSGNENVKIHATKVTSSGGIRYQMQDLDDGSYYTIGAKAYEAYIAAKTSGS